MPGAVSGSLSSREYDMNPVFSASNKIIIKLFVSGILGL